MNAPRVVGATSGAARAPVVALSANGHHGVAPRGDQLCTLDGTVLAPAAEIVAGAVLHNAIWLIARGDDGHHVARHGLDGAPLGAPITLGDLGEGVTITATRQGLAMALVEGERGVLLQGAVPEVRALGACQRDRHLLFGGRGVAERTGAVIGGAHLPAGLPLPFDLTPAVVVSGALIFDGMAALVELEHAGGRIALVFDVRTGVLRSRIRLGTACVGAVAARRGLVVLFSDTNAAVLDLRAGRCVGERVLPAPVAAVAIDEDGSRILVLGDDGELRDLHATLGVAVLEAEGPIAPAEPDRDESDTSDTQDIPDDEDDGPVAEDDPPDDHDTDDTDDEASDALERLDDVVLLSLRPAGATAAPDPEAVELYLDILRGWVAARCRVAVAAAWDTGRLGGSNDPAGALDALLDRVPGRASARLEEARALERAASERLDAWGPDAPHLAIGRDLGLSPAAVTLLVLVAAPHLWGELASVYRMLAAEPGGPLVDELVLSALVDADAATRATIARELDPDGPLLRSGSCIVGAQPRPHAGLTAHPLIVRRLAGEMLADPAPAALPLSAVIAPAAPLAALVSALALATTSPARVVLSGRPGAGRRTLAAALAARADRALAEITVGPELEPPALTRALHDANLRGRIPCVSIDELPDDPAVRRRIQLALDAHPGPLVVRAGHDQAPPLAPGYHALALPPLDERARTARWQASLETRGMPTEAAPRLAARFAIGPGVIERACEHAACGAGPSEARLAAAVRQHQGARLGEVARRVDTLAGWDELVLADEMLDALRELIARVEQRARVLDDWGMGRIATSARGVTALFQGGPGTGKSMTAGVIASALGYRLWRVDLSRVMSRWLGETERNLGRVFDAAEEGEVVLLFDEADSLFGKRTEVRSSHDRYANLEVNYLLQRLDDFTGIAVLTTNFGTAIDPAFKRRLSLHLQFPFPDERERERLWRAHLPATLPVADDLDLGALARRYPLSGGFIRNAALRAAYLAASAGRAITQAGLIRAVQLEYASHGKLGDGRLE